MIDPLFLLVGVIFIVVMQAIGYFLSKEQDEGLTDCQYVGMYLLPDGRDVIVMLNNGRWVLEFARDANGQWVERTSSDVCLQSASQYLEQIWKVEQEQRTAA